MLRFTTIVLVAVLTQVLPAGGAFAEDPADTSPQALSSLADCNGNGVEDTVDIAAGTSNDCNTNGVPDECDVWPQSLQPGPAEPLNANADLDSGDDVWPQITTDGLGNWIAVWDSDDDLGGTIGTDRDILFSRSTDNGATWTSPVPLNGNADTDLGDDRWVQITTDGSGNWVAVWTSDDDLGATIGTDEDILCARSADNGSTWTYPVPLNTSAISLWHRDNILPQIASDGSGTWIAAWMSDDPLGGPERFGKGVHFSRSTDNGATWTYPSVLNSNAVVWSSHVEGLQLETDRIGNWIAVWTSPNGVDGTEDGDWDIYITRSANNGMTWTPEAELNNPVSYWADSYLPKITADGLGNWVANWQSFDSLGDTLGPDWDLLFTRSTDHGETWSLPSPLNGNASVDSYYDDTAEIETDGLGNWIAVWRSPDDLGGTIGWGDDILFAQSRDDGATWTYPAPFYAQSGMDAWPRLASDGKGNWVAVWYSDSNPGGIFGTDFDIFSTTFQLAAAADCNSNGAPDECDIEAGVSQDCQMDGIPDDCQVADSDCNSNSIPDECDLAAGTSNDCNSNGVPDECEPQDDCNANGVLDFCDLHTQSSADCNTTGIPDECEIEAGTSQDCPSDGIPDECQYVYDDCNGNGVSDGCEVMSGSSEDCNTNGVPDECELRAGTTTPRLPQCLNGNAAVDSDHNDVYPRLTTDGSGNWVAVWRSTDDLGGTIGDDWDIFISRSQDDGWTWTYPVPLNGNADVDAEFDGPPQTATDGLGNWVAVWHSTNDFGGTIGTDYDIFVARSTDNGATWTSPRPLNSNAAIDSGSDHSVQITQYNSGNWIAVWTSADDLGGTIGADGDILFAQSTDNGETWTYPEPLNANANVDVGVDCRAQLATDGRGNWVAVWESENDLGGTIGLDRDIVVARSMDNGVTWTYPAPLNANANVDTGDDWRPQIATDGLGNWVAVWDTCTDLDWMIGTDGDILFARSTDNGATWTYPKPLNADAEVDEWWNTDTAPQITTDGLGNWIASWRTIDFIESAWIVDDDTEFARSTDNGATWSFPQPLNANADGDSGHDIHAQATPNGSGEWVAIWQSQNNIGGTIGTDFDIAFTRFRLGSDPDCNSNGILDECDIANGVSQDCNVNDVPDVCDVPGDFDGDGQVSDIDAQPFIACLTSPCVASPCEDILYLDDCCAIADADRDGDVDLQDFAQWQQRFNR